MVNFPILHCTYAIYAAVIGADAFVSSPQSVVPLVSSTTHLYTSNFGAEKVTRRGLFRSTALVGVASLLEPSSASAATETIISRKSPSTIVSNTLCEPSVSTFVKTFDETGEIRTVHLLGTAHISSASAELAGKIVRDIKPDVVFVELDAKRVARAIPGSEKAAVSSNVAAEFTSTPTPNDNDMGTPSNPFINTGSKIVGDSIKGMYKKMDSEGFKAGDEFAMSVKEGLIIGSTIVLGDRDVEVTLRRLTKALTKTDLRKLLNADSEVEKAMEEVLPENIKNKLQSAGTTSGDPMGDGTISKEELSSFVETMKSKENVKKIMAALKKVAPEIYTAMVAERDVYMGRGLDELGDNLKGKKVDSTVAIVGMAHVDGIETYLSSMGWKELAYPCPR